MLTSCHFCGALDDLTLHHLIRRELGGATEPENLLCVCRNCHEGINDGRINDTHLVHAVHLERIRRVLESVRGGASH